MSRPNSLTISLDIDEQRSARELGPSPTSLRYLSSSVDDSIREAVYVAQRGIVEGGVDERDAVKSAALEVGT